MLHLGHEGLEWPSLSARERLAEDVDEKAEDDERVENDEGGDESADRSRRAPGTRKGSLRRGKRSSEGSRPQTVPGRGLRSRQRPLTGEPETIRRLSGARRETKTLDVDCRKLENRIKLLQLEEAKVEQKIRKAKQDVKIVTQRRAMQRAKQYEQGTVRGNAEGSMRKAIQERNALQNQIHRVSKARSATLVRVQRKESARVVKESKQEIRQALIKQKQAEEEAVAAKREQIKAMRESARLSKAQAEAERHAKVQHDLQEKLRKEEIERKRRLRKLRKLEKLEQEHIGRLQAKQEAQRLARCELERTLHKPRESVVSVDSSRSSLAIIPSAFPSQSLISAEEASTMQRQH